MFTFFSLTMHPELRAIIKISCLFSNHWNVLRKIFNTYTEFICWLMEYEYAGTDTDAEHLHIY